MGKGGNGLSVAILAALCLASGCARLIGADFERQQRTDGGTDAVMNASDAKSDAADGPASPLNDGGDAPADTGDTGDAPDSGREDLGGADGPDVSSPDACGECALNELRCGAGGRLEQCVSQRGCRAWVLLRMCGDSELCCEGTCKPIDAANCFACGAACDSSRPVCALETLSCACTKWSCPGGQDCVDGVCVRSSVLPLAPPARWTSSQYRGDVVTSFADVDHDGRADAIAVNEVGITVYRATASGGFAPNTWTTTGPFTGAYGTSFADVNGDGCADAIAIGDTSIIVRRSNCVDAFGASEVWGTTDALRWYTFFADVTGDGCADAIDGEEGVVLVRPATPCPASGTTTARFRAPAEAWTTNVYVGTSGTFFTDVTGDGKADAIVVNRDTCCDGVTVRRSDGTQFLPNERWTDDSFRGASAVLLADVTGDGLADAVAVKADGVYMRRSNRWFFGGLELLSDWSYSPSPNLKGPLFALTDVTGDARADLVHVNDDGVWVGVRGDRRIPVRFVQLVADAASALSDDKLEAAVSLANLVHRPAGVQFYVRASHVVITAALQDLTVSATASTTDLAAAKDAFNPGCDLGADLGGFPSVEQVKVVATRCALDGEILVYVAHVASSTALLPWEGKAFFMDPADLAPSGGYRLAHELGHYLGLPHVFGCCGDSALSHPDLVPGNLRDPETRGTASLSRFWDLVYAPSGTSNIMFNDEAGAASLESALKPIQATGMPAERTTGWYCPSGDATRPCDANARPGTICLQISDTESGTHNYCSGSPDLKGLGLRLPGDAPTVNVMSAGYALPVPDPTDIARRQPSLSLSQVEQIRRVLTYDIDTPIRDAGGALIWGGRPRLGL